MRIGNGPRLVVPRPGQPGRRGWYGQWRDRGQAYDLWREQERARLRNMPHRAAGDVKHQVVSLNNLKPGEHYRLLDANGRATGPRLSATKDDHRRYFTRVRRAHPQPETLHSQLSRILKRAHKLAMRED